MPIRQKLITIPNGNRGTKETLRQMRRFANDGKKAPAVRLAALALTRDLCQKDWMGEINELFDFVQNRIRYVRDIRGVETLHTPVNILKLKQGDCDDKSILLASLLMSIGHPVRFVAVAFNNNPNFSHVLVETKVGGKWIPLDTTEPHELGWYPPKVTRRMVAHI